MMSVSVVTDLMSFFNYPLSNVRIFLNVDSHEKKCARYLMFPQDIHNNRG